MGNAAHESHTFHILQRLLEAKNVSVIEDDCPNRMLLRKTLLGTTFGSIMHKSDNTRAYVHKQVYACSDEQNETRSGSRPNRPKADRPKTRAPPVHPGAAWQ